MRFVTPDVVRIELGDGDWIEIKKELTVGEERKFRTAGMTRMHPTQGGDDVDSTSIDVDWSRMALAKVEAYLVEWSDKRKVTLAAIQSLSSEDFDKIDKAIEKHIKEEAERKKEKSGSEAVPVTS